MRHRDRGEYRCGRAWRKYLGFSTPVCGAKLIRKQIVASFTFTAWLTVGLAGFVAWDEASRTWRDWRHPDGIPRSPQDETGRGDTPTGSHQPKRQRTFQIKPPASSSASSSGGDSPSSSGVPPPSSSGVVPPSSIGVGEVQAAEGEVQAAEGEVQAAEGKGRKVVGGVPRRLHVVKKLLGTLCDLQAITGLGITLSGWVQWADITPYHAQLVSAYYSMTMNSFWAARVNYGTWDDDAGDENAKWLATRRLTILVGSLANLGWQAFVYKQEMAWDYWSDSRRWGDSGDVCFKYPGGGDPTFLLVFWGVGQLLFTISLALSTHPWTNQVNENILSDLEQLAGRFQRRFSGARKTWKAVTTAKEQSVTRRAWNILRSTVTVVAWSVSVILSFLFLQLLDVWSFGEASYPFSWAVYVLLMAWDTFYALALVKLNQPIIENGERTGEMSPWGFGQVLPLVMLLSVVYTAVDALKGTEHSLPRNGSARLGRNSTLTSHRLQGPAQKGTSSTMHRREWPPGSVKAKARANPSLARRLRGKTFPTMSAISRGMYPGVKLDGAFCGGGLSALGLDVHRVPR